MAAVSLFPFCLFQPELVYQSTTVVQHHSCRTLNPLWSYPLSLARHIWSTCISKAVDGNAETDKETPQRKTEMPQKTVAERQSCLPQALPLTCPSPHWHRLVWDETDRLSSYWYLVINCRILTCGLRWRVKDCLVQKLHLDQDLSTELVKVMWCNGITYRYVCSKRLACHWGFFFFLFFKRLLLLFTVTSTVSHQPHQ